MGRKGGLAALFSPRSSRPASGAAAPSPPWPWPSCATKPQTASFRRHGAGAGDDDRPCCTTASASGGSRLRPPRGKQAAAGADGDVMYKTVNSVYFDDAAGSSGRSSLFDNAGREEEDTVDAEEGLDDGTFSTTTAADEEWSEAVIRSLGRTSTNRFFFDAGAGPAPAPSSTNSILPASPSPFTSTTARTLAPPAEADAARKTQAPPPPKCKCPGPGPGLGVGVGLDCEPAGSSEQLQDDSAGSGSDDCGLLGTSSLVLEESVAVALDSADPFRDFRASMAEMVAAHGLRDWAALQEMLLWYLRINGKRNHALIVGAFVDLLVGLATSNNNVSSSSTATTATATTTTTAATPCSSSSSSSDSASTSGDVAAARRHTAAVSTAAGPAAVEEQEQCGGGGSAGASCSSASSSSDLGLGEAAAGRGRTGIGGAIR